MSFPQLLVFLLLLFKVSAFPLSAKSSSWLQQRSEGGIKVDFDVGLVDRNTGKRHLRSRSGKQKREEIITSLTNFGIYYSTNLTFGSQKDVISVDVDTGSADLWVIAANATCVLPDYGQTDEYCWAYGTFNTSQSTTSVDQNRSFAVSYGEGGGYGELYSDQVSISGVSVSSAIFGVLVNVDGGPGNLGVGYASTEASVDVGYNESFQYPNFPEMLVSQGLISKNYYSLYLNSPEAESGSLIFGGIDASKYSGDLVTLPLFNTTNQFIVKLDSVSYGNLTNATAQPVLLDSGTTATYLQPETVEFIAGLYENATYNADWGAYFVASNETKGHFTYHFGEAEVSVSLSSLLSQEYNNGTLLPGYLLNVYESDDPYFNIMGDNFLRWAYVVFDITDSQVSIAQSKFS